MVGSGVIYPHFPQGHLRVINNKKTKALSFGFLFEIVDCKSGSLV